VAIAPIVSVRGLVKRYGRRLAVDGVSFEVRPGEILALLGPNGAGKTTVLKCLLGLVRPDAGHILLGGLDARRAGGRARVLVGAVPQRTDLGDEVTGRELLDFAARLRRLGPDAIARAAGSAGATHVLGRTLATLSGGELQRVVLAQALLGDPPLLVLDEPTVSLDPLAQYDYVHLLAGLRDSGKAVLLSSHLLSEVERVADRALVLESGRPLALWARADWAGRGLEALFLEALGREPQGAPHTADAPGTPEGPHAAHAPRAVGVAR
jgi:ABC-type multidrug transport system ATPase subunit